MESMSSRRYSRTYTGSITASLDSYSLSNFPNTARKYSSPSLFKSYANSGPLSSPSIAAIYKRRDDNNVSDCGYWSSASTPKSLTRASSEAPNGAYAVPDENISSVMNRYLPGGCMKDPINKSSWAGSMSNLSSSLVSSLTSLSSNSTNFMTSSVLDRRASRKRKELLASTRSTSVERYTSDSDQLYRRQGSVDRSDYTYTEVEGNQKSTFSRSSSLSRSGSLRRNSLDSDGASRAKPVRCDLSSTCLNSSLWSSSSIDDTYKRDTGEDSSGLLRINEGLARVTEALSRHEQKTASSTSLRLDSSLSQKSEYSNFNGTSWNQGLSSKKSCPLKPAPPQTLLKTSAVSNYRPRSASNAYDKLDDITSRLLSFDKSSSGRRPWRRGRVSSTLSAYTVSLSQRSPSKSQDLITVSYYLTLYGPAACICHFSRSIQM